MAWDDYFTGSRLTRQEFVTRLLDLGRRHGDLPIYGSDDWEALPPTDPRRFASVVRAAECWRLESEPEAVRRRLVEDEWMVRTRVRDAGLDVHDGPLGVDSQGTPFTWARRTALTPIAELHRLRTYEPEVA